MITLSIKKKKMKMTLNLIRAKKSGLTPTQRRNFMKDIGAANSLSIPLQFPLNSAAKQLQKLL